MSNYTHRPHTVFCTEMNESLMTLILAWAKENNIPINRLMSGEHNKFDTVMAWKNNELIGSTKGLYQEVPLSTFMANFKSRPPIDYKKELLTAIETICNEYKQKHNL